MLTDDCRKRDSLAVDSSSLLHESHGSVSDVSVDPSSGSLRPDPPRRPERPLGHAREREALERLLRAARSGQGQVLVVRGGAGLGKTTLLAHAESASGFRVARVGGVESEQDLPFAALHRLCAPMLDRAGRLPGPQREALAAAFGVRQGGAIDRFLVGLAVLGLLAEVTADQALVCTVDDARWLDRPSRQVLAFVARRLGSEPAALLFATDEPIEDLKGLPELVLHGLSGAEARALLASVVPGPLDTRVRDRIIAESHGNPRTLLGLSHAWTPEQLAGGFGLPAALAPVDPLAGTLRSQLEGLPVQTRRLLLVAAAEPEGDPALLRRAASRLGIEASRADEAYALGLLDSGTPVTFRHPHMRSAVYHDAPLDERRRVHQALADATDPEVDPERRAWHRAHATLAPDGDVADSLERSATRAHRRGGHAAAAAFLERSAFLTPEPGRRARRALAAGHAKFDAGSFAAAAELLTVAGAGSLDELDRARLGRLRAKLAFAQRRGGDAPRLLLEAARMLEPLDVRLARDTYLEAFEATIVTGRLGTHCRPAEVAAAARAAPSTASPCAADHLLDGLAALFTDGHAVAAPALRRAVRAYQSADDIRWLGLACRAAAELWDADATLELATRHARLARDAGALTCLPTALDHLAGVQVHAGAFGPAADLIEEATTMSQATAQVPGSCTSLALAAWRGSEAETTGLMDASMREALDRGDGWQITATDYAAAVLYNGLGRYDDALRAARQAGEREELLSCWVLPELIEAAARAGERALAVEACERLVERTQISGTEWALGIEARSLALVTEGPATDKLYREAIERLGRCRVSAHLARAHLVYGEWLRRQRRRRDARGQLRTAHEMFTTMGAAAFAARAQRELLATGERARKRTVETIGELTPQEVQIARLARDGHSNPQIGARLFISARTVEYHLHKVFTKLGISSRNQLAYTPDLDAT
jgi:DNA-binding CsgD family transcriptional regulator